MLKLWILRPVGNWGSEPPAAWHPWYDKCFGFVVRAETEHLARQFAAEQSGDEGASVWLDTSQSDCTELTAEGVEGVVIQDFYSA